MTIDLFILRMVILLLPGVAALKVYRQLRSSGPKQKQLKDWQDFLTILVFSVTGYLFVWVAAHCLTLLVGLFSASGAAIEVSMLQALLDQGISINYFEIAATMILTVLLAIGAAWATNRKLFFRFFRHIGITSHFGDEDVWSYIQNSTDVDWVIVRDHRQNMAYYAYIMVFSDSGEKRELLLGDVDVYRNSDGRFLYSTDKLYICRDDYELSLEITDKQQKRERARQKG